MFSNEQISKNTFNGAFFGDVSTNSKLVKYLGKINRDSFTVQDNSETVDAIADFINIYIDTNNFVASPHAKLWTRGDQNVRETVSKILQKQTDSPKNDKSFDVYIMKLVCNIIGDYLGGFDFTVEEDVIEPPLTFMRKHKRNYNANYIERMLTSEKDGGYVVCLENDHGCFFDTIPYISMKPDTYPILYLELNKNIHKGNKAKGIYYTSNLKITELSLDEIRIRLKMRKWLEDGSSHAHLPPSGNPKYLELLDTYKDCYAVCSVSRWSKYGVLYSTPTYVMIHHNKSTGGKFDDVLKNYDEYCLGKAIRDTLGDNVQMLGDFNIPERTVATTMFNLTENDLEKYPLQDTFDCDEDDCHMVRGMKRLSNFDDDTIGYKTRLPDVSKCSQCVKGKYGKRNYHTEYMYSKTTYPITEISTVLYPNKKISYPYINKIPEKSWFSDHQSTEITLSSEQGTKMKVVLFNTLSNCCSGDQPFKYTLKNNERVIARKEFITILSKHIQKNIVFDECIYADLIELNVNPTVFKWSCPPKAYPTHRKRRTKSLPYTSPSPTLPSSPLHSTVSESSLVKSSFNYIRPHTVRPDVFLYLIITIFYLGCLSAMYFFRYLKV
jgi:hypothetical protein